MIYKMIAGDFMQFVASYTIFLISFSQVSDCVHCVCIVIKIIGVSASTWFWTKLAEFIRVLNFICRNSHPKRNFFRLCNKIKRETKKQTRSREENYLVACIIKSQSCSFTNNIGLYWRRCIWHSEVTAVQSQALSQPHIQPYLDFSTWAWVSSNI